MFKKFKTYTHKAMLDVVVLVLTSYRLEDGRYRLKVRWFNRRGIDLGIQETITITKPQVKNWYEMEIP